MNDQPPDLGAAGPARESIHYWRSNVNVIDQFQQGHIDVPIFLDGQAQVVYPRRGCVIRGTLVNCPETESEAGWIVLDTSSETVAVQSPAFSELVIENDPCELELVAIPLTLPNGSCYWDWEAYEISPNGSRILVSEPHCQPRADAFEASCSPASEPGRPASSHESGSAIKLIP